jgi:hypothetical protein
MYCNWPCFFFTFMKECNTYLIDLWLIPHSIVSLTNFWIRGMCGCVCTCACLRACMLLFHVFNWDVLGRYGYYNSGLLQLSHETCLHSHIIQVINEQVSRGEGKFMKFVITVVLNLNMHFMQHTQFIWWWLSSKIYGDQ